MTEGHQLHRGMQELRKDIEHLRDVIESDQKKGAMLQERVAAVEKLAGVAWERLISMETTLSTKIDHWGLEMTKRQDRTNGTLKRHEWQIAFATGGVAVISFAIPIAVGIYLALQGG